ncbi:MAG: CRISPR-associated endonuclease Cas2 [Tissierellia bacterium]|nr:CRISPR-associated endonuclease Cas2 [Tissierellia bacterium]
MMVLVTYDVETVSKDGQRRLRQVAKCLVNYGQRVQNSVFECVVTPAQLAEMKIKLSQIIDEEKDSLRIYHIGKNWQIRVENMGRQDTYDPERDTLMF